MKRFIYMTCAGVLTAAMASPSFAADLPRPAYKAPYPAYTVAPYSWTGFYVGANGGYIWSGSDNGFAGGGQLGYNYQIGSIVFGLEGDFQATSLKAEETAGGITGTTKVKYFGTARGRIGYAFDRALVYGTGGLAYTNTDLSITDGVTTLSDSSWSSGYTLGGGLEWAASDRWSVKAEYLFVHSGDVSLTLGGVTVEGNYDMHVVRAGLNYRF